MQGKRKRAGDKAAKKFAPSTNRLSLPDLKTCTVHPAAGVLKKHRCPDCFFCQGCSQDRCRLCRTQKKPVARKLSMAEQIALYERINRKKTKKVS
ncbi:MAG: hypothetical protein AB1585_08470 [Thermodesulfobacteriota bacterium]